MLADFSLVNFSLANLSFANLSFTRISVLQKAVYPVDGQVEDRGRGEIGDSKQGNLPKWIESSVYPSGE